MARNSNTTNKQNKTAFYESKLRNARTYQLYYNRLMQLAISRFKWSGLPPEIDERFLELTLFSDGLTVFFKDEELDEYLTLQCVMSGGFNVYRIPLNRRAYAVNGYNKELTINDSVIIFNDILRTNTMLACEEYALRMYEIERTIDVNIKAQKTPVLIKGTEDQKLTLANLYMKYDGNEPFIFGYKDSMNLESLEVLKTDAPFVAKDLQILKGDIWNEALTYLGISNVNSDKRERLITSEVEATNNPTLEQQNIWLLPRKQACEKINKMFGLNVSVEFNNEYVGGGKVNGVVYDTSQDDM